MEVQRILDKVLLGIVYKNAIEYKFNTKRISYERDNRYIFEYQGAIYEPYNWGINILGISCVHWNCIQFWRKFLVIQRVIL